MSFKDEFASAVAPDTGGNSAIAEGEYMAEISDCQIDLTKDPVRLSVTYTLITEKVKNRKVWGSYQLKGQGLGFCKKDMKTLGIDYSKVAKPEDIASLFYDKLATRVKVYIKPKEYQGKTYNSVYLNEVLNKAPQSAAAKKDHPEIPF